MEQTLSQFIQANQNQNILIVGHPYEDLDSIVSIWLLAKIFNKLGIPSFPCVSDKFDALSTQTKKAMEYLNIEYNDFCMISEGISNISDYAFMVDFHNNRSCKETFIPIGIIDHHPTRGGPIPDAIGNSPVIIQEAASNSLLLFEIFKEMYRFSKEELVAITVSVFMDTLYLKNSKKLKQRDVDIISKWEPIIGENLQTLCKECMTSFIGSPNFDNIQDEFKRYEVPIHANGKMTKLGMSYSSGCICMADENSDISQMDDYQLKGLLKDCHKYMLVIYDLYHDKTCVIFNYRDSLTSCNAIYKFNMIAARGSFLTSFIREIFMEKRIFSFIESELEKARDKMANKCQTFDDAYLELFETFQEAGLDTEIFNEKGRISKLRVEGNNVSF